MKNLINWDRAKWENYDHRAQKKAETTTNVRELMRKSDKQLSEAFYVEEEAIRIVRLDFNRVMRSANPSEAEVWAVVSKIEDLLNQKD